MSLGLATIAVFYAVVSGGGDAPYDSSVSLLLAGLAGALCLFPVLTCESHSRFDRVIDGLAVLVPAAVAIQLVPLPLWLLGILSPGRAELANALGGVTTAPSFAPLTISAPATSVHLVRVTGCAAIFLSVRHFVRQSNGRWWWAAVPLIAIGVLETIVAFSQAPANGVGPLTGAFANKNHFAGLLEMIVPLAAAGAAAMVVGGRWTGGNRLPATVLGLLFLLSAALMLIAVPLSLSKGGTMAMLVALLAMGIVEVSRLSSGRSRASLMAFLVVSAIVAFVCLAPIGLIEQFGVLTTSDPSEGRLPIWRDTLHLVGAYPLFGVGLGNLYPGLLPYQTYGLSLAWVNAHNDYVQLLAELGVVGWLVPAALMSVVLWRALRVATSDATRDVRLLGLACVGGLTAFLAHAVSEFNAYVLSNAMVLSWVAGIAAGLPARADRSHHVQLPRLTRAAWFAAVPAVIVFTVASSSTWLLFLQRFHQDPVAERMFCRFGICDSDAALGTLRRAPEGAVANVPVDDLIRYLARDSAAPDRWDDVGEALQKGGDVTRARYAYNRAVGLAPRSPSILLASADFHFDAGETRPALALIARGLSAGDDIDRAAFADLEYRKVPVGDALRDALPDCRSVQAYFGELLHGDSAGDVVEAWDWMLARGDGDDDLGRRYVDFLVAKNEPDAAARGWAAYVRGRSLGYPDTNLVFNGGFDTEPSGCRFDWRVDRRAAAAAIEFDPAVRRTGARSLRLRFDGSANPGRTGVEQIVFLRPGRYRIQAYVRTEELSTDQGLHLRVVNDAAPKTLDVTTDDLRGTNDWTLVERVFDAPPAPGLVRISVERTPSLKFDSLIRGTAWIDDVSLARTSQP